MKVWTVIDIIRWGTEYFTSKGIESPRLNIELIACHALSLERIGLYTNFDKPLAPDELAAVKEMVLKRAGRIPLQYIMGWTEFFGLRLELNPFVLIPRPETEQLVEFILSRHDATKPATIVDVGSGSGCIAIALAARLPLSKVCGYDISEKAVETATRNAVANNVANVEFKTADILKARKFEKRYDIFVSNPPYIPSSDMENLQPEVKDHEPRHALTDEQNGLTFYRKFAEIIPLCVRQGGKFYLEAGHGQYDRIRSIFCDANLQTNLMRDFAGLERVVYGTVDS